MSPSLVLRLSLLRAVLRPQTTLPIARTLPSMSRLLTTSQSRLAGPGDYGSGAGDPKGENPQEQGKSDKARKEEHPGPASPADSSSGGGTTNSSGTQGGSSKGRQPEPSGSSSGGGAQGEKKAGSKISQHDISQQADRVESDDVKQHNADMAKRHDRPNQVGSDVEDKVDKGFWSGQGGADRDP